MGFCRHKFYQYFLILTYVCGLINSRKEYDIPPVTKFVVENEKCHIPYFDPWAFLEFYENKSYIPCPTEPPFTFIEKEKEKIYLVINETIKSFYVRNGLNMGCCVSNITRSQTHKIPDDKFEEGKCIPFGSTGRFEVLNDVVLVNCHKYHWHGKTLLFENVYGSFIRSNIEEKLKYEGDTKPYSVLMVLIDSLPRSNFARLLPQTLKYLQKNRWNWFEGFNQVGKASLGNILPMLTGFSERDCRKRYGNTFKNFFDRHDFVWYDYHKYGYVTAFAEDFSSINTFNNGHKGFSKTPTDYYFRSFSMASDSLHTSYLDGMPHCSGNENAAEKILNLAKDFVSTFKSQPYFGLFWLNSFSHDDLNAPGRMDVKLLEFLQGIENHLDNTIVFFLSDHGYHKDGIPNTVLGWFESRQPFLSIHLPSKFKTNFPMRYENLQGNTKKLVSPYDVYATMQDILVFSGTNHVAKLQKTCASCMSIFTDMPPRSCNEAGVQPYWCTCLSLNLTQPVHTNETSNFFIDL